MGFRKQWLLGWIGDPGPRWAGLPGVHISLTPPPPARLCLLGGRGPDWRRLHWQVLGPRALGLG